MRPDPPNRRSMRDASPRDEASFSPSTLRRSALLIALGYLIVACLWILGTGRLVSLLALDVEHAARLEAIKGAAFVTFSAIVLYIALRRFLLITDHAHQDLLSNERIYHSFFEQAAVGMVRVLPDGRFIEANPRACQILGYPRDILLRKSFQEITHPEDLSGEISNYAREKRYLRPDGSPVCVRITVNLVRQADGKPDFFMASIEDIEAIRRCEAALQETESRYRILADQDLTGVYLVVDGVLTFVNRKFAEMHGYAPKELIGRRLLDLIAVEDRATVEEQIRRRLFGEVVSSHYVARGLRRDGSHVHVEIASRLTVVDGRPALMGAALNISERRQSAEALRAARERLRALASRQRMVLEDERTRIAWIVQHELGQILAALKDELLKAERRLGGPREDSQDSAIQCLRRCLGLAESAIAAADRVALQFRPAALDEGGLAAAIRQELERFQRESGIQCVFETANEDLTLTREAATGLFRIFQQALDNIAQHAKASRVQVTLQSAADDTVDLRIEDNGVGIGDAALQNERSVGLLEMREAASALAGTFAVGRLAEGGTWVRACVPFSTAPEPPPRAPLHA
jgi:two-component system sensor histidine kinase UhpB